MNLIKRFLEAIAHRVACPFGTWIAAGSLALQAGSALGVFGGGKGNQAADSSSNYYNTLASLSADQFSEWQQSGLPLLQSLTTQAQTDRTAQETELATGAVKDTFAAARSNMRRSLNLTGGDQTDRAVGALAPSYLDEAAKVSGAITDARRSEQNRIFNQSTQVENIWNKQPAQAIAGLGAAAAGEGNLARTYGYLGAQRADAASQLGYSGAILGPKIANWFSTPGGGGPSSADVSAATPSGPNDYGFREGGAIRRRLAYADGGGVIKGPGTGTSDSIPAKSRPGSYILSADTVRAIGHKKVHQIIEQAGVRPGQGGTSYNGVPVRVSNGEAEIPPEAVRHHGEEYFNKLQQKYHRPVMDDDDGHANGGAIRKRGLPRSVEEAIFRSMPHQAVGRRL